MGLLRQSGAIEAEFTSFVAARSQHLHAYAFALTSDIHAAEDLVQLVLSRMYVHWHKIRHDDPVFYAQRALARAAIDRWRHTGRHEISVSQFPDAPTGSDLVEEVAVRQALLRSLAALTMNERAVLVMRYFGSMTERQISDALDLPKGTIKSTAARGIRKLRADLGENPSPLGDAAAPTSTSPGGDTR